jgi:large conductance mechanosensitive channel
VLADIRSFLGRYTVIELLVAFAVAGSVVGLVASVVNGLVYTPIEQRASGFSGSGGPLSFVIGGRVFDTAGILVSGIGLVLVLAAAAYYVHLNRGTLWQDESEVTTCSHCLSEIPATATVCSYCTRDLRPQAPSE